MRTFLLFALTLVGTAVLTDDVSAFGKRGRRGQDCCSSGYTTGYMATGTGCCGQTAMAYGNYGQAGMVYNSGYAAYGSNCCGQTGVAYGSPYGAYGMRYGGYYNTNGMYPGGVYQSGYYTPGTVGNGVVPAGGTIDPKTGTLVNPQTIPKPMPDK